MKSTILLIEDNLEMRENTAEILELANYNVLTAKNGKEGLDFIKKNKPDLILCDIMMPELDGYGVLREIGNIREIDGIPFVFLTALSEKINVRAGMTQGADDYLTKPYSSDELLEVVNIRLKKANLMKEPFKNNQEGFNVFTNVNYASKVHKAFLTKDEEIKSIFPQSFLIYKPQEIISGDFYHVHSANNISTIVLGDSTGHGVSASYISIAILNILNKVVREGLDNPAEALQTVHKEMLHSTHSDKTIALIESADTIICSFDHKSRILHYSSARINGAIVREGTVIELQKDNVSIGDHTIKSISLTNHFMQLEKGDCLYLFSDGMENQFGEAENKRFNHKQLLKILGENYLLSMENQKQNMSDVLTAWQGKKDQTDDMTLLGIKID